MSYFPMYVELKDKPCLIVGGGLIAYRKVLVLKDFEAQITVIAPEICQEIIEINGIICIQKPFEERDLENISLVVAATDQKQLNHRISDCCKKKKIPVNAVDQVEDCSFIFPSYIKEGEVVASFSSGGLSPVITQYLKKEAKPFVTNLLSELANCLGSLRTEVKKSVATEEKRKQLYQELLELGLEKGEVPKEEEVKKILKNYQNQ